MARKKKTSSDSGPRVETIRHKDKRKNIPTSELSKFVKKSREEEYKPTLYPRNPELDPQLVWKGKDQQDSKPLEVPNVPIYIHEKIHPQAIINMLKRQSKDRQAQQDLNLFADFNGIEFEDLIDFYHHDSNWANRMILGDSLSVMNSLSERENLKGRVQCIYMDPPYGINFGSNWQVSTKQRVVGDGKTESVAKEPEQVKAFRDTWEFGINSYLSYLRDRLFVCRQLLSEAGSLFVQIGEENVHRVRTVLDEIYGDSNFVSQISVFKTTTPRALLDNNLYYLLWYAKDIEKVKYRQIFLEKNLLEWTRDTKGGSWGVEINNTFRALSPEEKFNPTILPRGANVYQLTDLSSAGESKESLVFEFEGEDYSTRSKSHWKTTGEGLKNLSNAYRIETRGGRPWFRKFHKDFPVTRITNVWGDTSGKATERIYVVQTQDKVIERCLLLTSDPGDLVIDPTCGSGTTAYVAEQWGRRWITIDTSRVALALARTRLMSARYPYYILADSKDGLKKEGEITGRIPPEYSTQQDVKKGFVYNRVPHVTLKSIAKNPDIKPGMSKEGIDEAIARYAETELLYDQPYEDNQRVRVTGPFTVESLSPHRVLDTEIPRAATEASSDQAQENGSFETSIIENLRISGIQNTKKHERLIFESVEPHAGSWIQAYGYYKDKSGKRKKVAISIGPKYGTITPEHVKQASIEAMKGAGSDLLVILGFAFGSYVTEEVKEYGDLTILIVRMNPDLMIGGDLLKKTGSGNLFTVFGEPDIELKQKDGKYTVEIKGVDIYDPTTGEIRSSSPDEIACWFIDTEYNEQSFFVRHAYFTGANDPYDKLRRALKAEIDEAAWSSLYSTKSRPFDKPETGKIAVKVINHYGDEVMKVFDIKD